MSPPPSTKKAEETDKEKGQRLMQKLLNNETLTTEELEFLATPHPGMNQLPRDNPGEWRHGEFAEEDPFEEYF